MSSQPVILVAVDKSQQSEDAFKFYLETFHQHSHKIIFIHVVQLPSDFSEARHANMSTSVILEEWNKEEEKTQGLFEKFQNMATAKGISGTQNFLKKGMNAGHVITEAAAEKKASTVIMGTRGMGKIRRTILGSVSDFVLHHAHCPVVICRK